MKCLRRGALLVVLVGGLLIGWTQTALWAQAPPTIERVIEELTSRYYDLKTAGARDLVCTVTSPNIDSLVEQRGGGEDVKVRIKFLWKAPNRQQYKVTGMPAGPSELRRDLVRLFSGKGTLESTIIARVARKTLMDLLKQCEPTITVEDGVYKIEATVDDPNEGIDHFEAYVNPSDWVIERIVTYLPSGDTVTTTYETEEKGGRRHITKEIIQATQGDQTSQIEISYAYLAVDGVWALQRAVAKVTTPDGQEANLVFDFSNYQVNLGLPDSMFRSQTEGAGEEGSSS